MLNIREFLRGLKIAPKATSDIDSLGELEVSSVTNKILFHNGSSASPLMTEAQAGIVTNKTIDADQNIITNIHDANIKAGADIAVAKLAPMTANRAVITDNSGVISPATATSTEVSFLEGVTSNIQTQINDISFQIGITDLTGDVTATGPNSAVATISANAVTTTKINNSAVTNTKLANMAAHTIKGNNTGSSSAPLDLTPTEVTAELNVVVGDSGSGGTKGLVPAAAAGDAAADKFLKASGVFASLPVVVVPKVVFIKDVKTPGTDGGTFTSGAWRTRDLNTLEDPQSHGFASVSSNQFILTAGTYIIEASADAGNVARHQAKLRNITASTDDIIGTSSESSPAGSVFTRSLVYGIVSPGVTTTYEIQHQCQISQSTNGFGLASGADFTVVNEIYTVVKITKIT